MNNPKEKGSNKRQLAEMPGVTPELLKAEIGFWQEMIRFSGCTATEESMERMHQALALAQRKLRQFESMARSTPSSPEKPSENVYFIKRHA